MLTTSGRAGLALALAAILVSGPRTPQVLQSLGAADPATALGALLELGLLATSSWFVAAVGLAAAPGTLGRCGRALVPAAVRTTVFVGVVGAGFGGVAHAESSDWPVEGLRLPERALVDPSPTLEDTPGPSAPESGPPADEDGEPDVAGRLPHDVAQAPEHRSGASATSDRPGDVAPVEQDRPAVPRHRARTPMPTSTGATTTTTRDVVVAPGDTLWALATASLPAAAAPRDVQERVGSIHRANRQVIGDDPDLIRPGQRITVPTTDGAGR